MTEQLANQPGSGEDSAETLVAQQAQAVGLGAVAVSGGGHFRHAAREARARFGSRRAEKQTESLGKQVDRDADRAAAAETRQEAVERQVAERSESREQRSVERDKVLAQRAEAARSRQATRAAETDKRSIAAQFKPRIDAVESSLHELDEQAKADNEAAAVAEKRTAEIAAERQAASAKLDAARQDLDKIKAYQTGLADAKTLQALIDSARTRKMKSKLKYDLKTLTETGSAYAAEESGITKDIKAIEDSLAQLEQEEAQLTREKTARDARIAERPDQIGAQKQALDGLRAEQTAAASGIDQKLESKQQARAEALERLLQSGDAAKLGAAVTGGGRFRLLAERVKAGQFVEMFKDARGQRKDARRSAKAAEQSETKANIAKVSRAHHEQAGERVETARAQLEQRQKERAIYDFTSRLNTERQTAARTRDEKMQNIHVRFNRELDAIQAAEVADAEARGRDESERAAADKRREAIKIEQDTIATQIAELESYAINIQNRSETDTAESTQKVVELESDLENVRSGRMKRLLQKRLRAASRYLKLNKKSYDAETKKTEGELSGLSTQERRLEAESQTLDDAENQRAKQLAAREAAAGKRRSRAEIEADRQAALNKANEDYEASEAARVQRLAEFIEFGAVPPEDETGDQKKPRRHLGEEGKRAVAVATALAALTGLAVGAGSASNSGEVRARGVDVEQAAPNSAGEPAASDDILTSGISLSDLAAGIRSVAEAGQAGVAAGGEQAAGAISGEALTAGVATTETTADEALASETALEAFTAEQLALREGVGWLEVLGNLGIGDNDTDRANLLNRVGANLEGVGLADRVNGEWRVRQSGELPENIAEWLRTQAAQ